MWDCLLDYFGRSSKGRVSTRLLFLALRSTSRCRYIGKLANVLIDPGVHLLILFKGGGHWAIFEDGTTVSHIKRTSETAATTYAASAAHCGNETPSPAQRDAIRNATDGSSVTNKLVCAVSVTGDAGSTAKAPIVTAVSADDDKFVGAQVPSSAKRTEVAFVFLADDMSARTTVEEGFATYPSLERELSRA